jgi:hypothetical protein
VSGSCSGATSVAGGDGTADAVDVIEATVAIAVAQDHATAAVVADVDRSPR